MYTENELHSIEQKLKKRAILIIIPGVVLTGLFVYAFIQHMNRNDSLVWLGYLSAALLAFMLIFCDGLFVAPLRAYKRLLKDVLYGRTRELKGYFKSLDATPCMRDNVSFYPLIVSENDLNNEEDDRLFYLDTLKPCPQLNPGDAMTVVSNDKRIANIII